MLQLQIAERKFDQFLPILRELYPNGRQDNSILQRMVEIYQNISFNENVIVALYDHKTAAPFFVSDNVERITGYPASTIYKWKHWFLFKALHISHYSFAFKTLQLQKKINSIVPEHRTLDLKLYVSGLKMVAKNGQIHHGFLKGRMLALDENQHWGISIFFVEDISHLVKGSNYWLRYTCGEPVLTYVNQKGKKVFRDLVTDRERELLQLMAQKKSNAEIADALCLSKATVETHRKNMIKRTGALNSTALVHLCKMANVI
ncbi:MAG: helix-turn-helix transcriptional regulator [Bacteroidota bacterium]